MKEGETFGPLAQHVMIADKNTWVINYILKPKIEFTQSRKIKKTKSKLMSKGGRIHKKQYDTYQIVVKHKHKQSPIQN